MSIIKKISEHKKKTAAVIAVLIILCTVYLCSGYKADKDAIVDYSANFNVTKSVSGRETVFYGEEINAGLIFYPGGKVDRASYEPLMMNLADKGTMCVLVDMPFDLAVFDINAADGIIERYPHTDSWYMAGHSLGGAMAASYIAENADVFDGLILLGAYSTADISNTDLNVLSVYGSEDNVLNKEKYSECMPNLPSADEVVIKGGNHAFFGMYGKQKGDGMATITNIDQINETSGAVADFVFGEE